MPVLVSCLKKINRNRSELHVVQLIGRNYKSNAEHSMPLIVLGVISFIFLSVLISESDSKHNTLVTQLSSYRVSSSYWKLLFNFQLILYLTVVIFYYSYKDNISATQIQKVTMTNLRHKNKQCSE